MAKWLEGLRVVVCAGSGGVGKTTLSAAMGIHLARSGKRVLVLTIDPARRLADALGIEASSQVAQVPLSGGGSLSAAMIDAEAVFREFVERSAVDSEVARRLLNNTLFKQLASKLSGSQEFTSLERLLESVETGHYDVVVLDTPPNQHAIDFLRAPERIFSLFQDSITSWFISEGRPGLLRGLLHQGTRRVFSALEKVTGSVFLGELKAFFECVNHLQKRVAERSVAVHRLLSSDQTGFVLITAFDDGKLKEAIEFSSDLQRLGHHLKAVLINRATPSWLGEISAQGHLGGDENLNRLLQFYGEISDYYRNRERHYGDILQRLPTAVEVLRLPEERESINGIMGLELIAKRLGG